MHRDPFPPSASDGPAAAGAGRAADPRAEAEARAGLLGRIAAGLAAVSLRHPALTLLLSALLGLASCWVLATRFELDTDSMRMFPADLPWRQAERAIDSAFPQRDNVIAVVVDGATPDAAERAAAALAAELQRAPRGVQSVARPDAAEVLRRSALLFPEEEVVRRATERIIAAQPMLGTLAADPSLRGVAQALRLLADGIARGEPMTQEAQLGAALSAMGDAAKAAAAGRVVPLDWARLFTGEAPHPLALRRFVLVQPTLDFAGLAPASAASATIQDAVARLGLTAEGGVRVRLTGSPVIRDEEFSTVFGGAIAENILSLLSVAALLWLGLRSMRLILPMLGVLVLGLVVTAAFGSLFIGAYNPLSIAFAVLFIGLAVDFAIQYSVCLREQRHRLRSEPLRAALVTAAAVAGPGIGLAALALCAGFLAFLPTDYRGLSELGIIASAGMVIGVVISLTTLPAWLAFTRPREEEQPVGYAALAPLDRALTRHARGVAVAAGLVALACAASLPFLRFDTNPLNLRNPTTEAVSTFRDLMRDPETTPNTIQVLAPDLDAAKALAARLGALPEVSGTRTLADFVPRHQEAKLALIRDTADLLGPTLEPPQVADPPDASETVRALALASGALIRAAASLPAGSALAAPAQDLGGMLRDLSQGPPAARDRLRAALLPGLATTLDGLRLALGARPVTVADLPDSIRRDWMTADGRARVEARPRDLSDRAEGMARFAEAVLAVEPAATGPAITVQASARTIGHAFLSAGVIASVLTALLLVVALRSWRLAMLALAPLALAGLLTLATCVGAGIALNLANIIALPLLFAQGVAFDIYYVMAWRAGERKLLPSALTRAVLYSALTNGTAFGTLALSGHPGTASMGVMLTLSLLYALVAVMLALPALLTLFEADAAP
jgi:hopanoid biosynthesis associated RND transporter like protein HpnN